MAKKKSIRVDFVKSCITYNKLNTIATGGGMYSQRTLQKKQVYKRIPDFRCNRRRKCCG